MNISVHAKQVAHSNQLKHRGIFSLNGPSNSVVANMARQLNQQFKQTSNNAQFFVGNNSTVVKPCITRVRLVMHDACVLSVQSMVNSLDPQLSPRLEQNELYFWKRDQGGISDV